MLEINTPRVIHQRSSRRTRIMKKLIPFTAFLVLAVLAACTTNPVTTNLEAIKKPVVDAKKTQVLGVLEVEISSEQGSVSSAKFIAANSGLSAKGVAVPINGTNWKFTPGTTTYMTDATFKYLQNTITLENKTGTSFSNLAMYALNTPTNLGGTAFTSVKTLSNGVVSNAVNVARAVMPTHGMSSVTAVDPAKADMMIYTPAEAAAVQAQLIAPGFTIAARPCSSTDSWPGILLERAERLARAPPPARADQPATRRRSLGRSSFHSRFRARARLENFRCGIWWSMNLEHSLLRVSRNKPLERLRV
jgi:hypothetical protein